MRRPPSPAHKLLANNNSPVFIDQVTLTTYSTASTHKQSPNHAQVELTTQLKKAHNATAIYYRETATAASPTTCQQRHKTAAHTMSTSSQQLGIVGDYRVTTPSRTSHVLNKTEDCFYKPRGGRAMLTSSSCRRKSLAHVPVLKASCSPNANAGMTLAKKTYVAGAKILHGT